MTAYLLVTLQMALIAALCLPVGPREGHPVAAVLLLVAGLGWSGWALSVNPPQNIRIRPVPRPGGRMVTTGPYRLVRHPMYLGVLVCGAGPACLWPAAWKAGAWILLLAVLIAKARREEAALRTCFPQYDAYRRARHFLIPGLW